MKMKSWKQLSVLVMSAMLLTGCGSSSQSLKEEAAYDGASPASVENSAAIYESGDYGGGAYEETATETYEEEAVAEEPAEAPAGDADAPEVADPLANRKLITTMNISAETEHFDELMSNVEKQITGLGGYIESSEQWNGSYNYYGERMNNRNAYLTVRIPADKLNAFIAVMEENSNIVSKSKSVEDVTLAYVDLESHKKALLTEQERLLVLMEKAETVEDLITLEDKLANVRYQLESMESQLRTYDNKINYSTIHLDISEVQRLTPEVELTTWGRIKSGFAENVYKVGEGIKDFFVNLIINIPFIIVWLVLIGIVLVIVLLLAKREKKKKAERLQRRQLQQTQMMPKTPVYPNFTQPEAAGNQADTVSPETAGNQADTVSPETVEEKLNEPEKKEENNDTKL